MIRFSIVFLFMIFFSWSQGQAITHDSIPKSYLIIGDTIANNSISLSEVIILPKVKFSNSDQRRRYLVLQRKTLKVYPYAKLAAERLTILNQRMINLKSNRKRKKYARLVQKFVEDEFAEKLKKFTVTEGQILIKLIHRQTGEIAFDLIKDLRSGWRAFWYQNTAKLFNMSLKTSFLPFEIEEDYLIEDILQRQFQNGNLEFQRGYEYFDLYELSKKWKK